MADPLDSPPIASIDPTQESTAPEIASREVDPVQFTHLRTGDTFLLQLVLNGPLGNRLVSYAVNSWLVKLVLAASHPSCTDSGPPVTPLSPFPIGTSGGV